MATTAPARLLGGHKATVLGKYDITLPAGYEMGKMIGRGAYGVVAEVRHGDRTLALKFSRVHDKDACDYGRVLTDVAMLRALRGCAGVVQLVDAWCDGAYVYLAMDRWGCDLHSMIVAEPSRRQLSAAHYRYFAAQLLATLAFLHGVGVVHRDVKSCNVLVNSDCALALTDFNLARTLPERRRDDGDYDMSGGVVSLWYRAPELALRQPYGPPADVWAAACTLAELVLHEPVWRADTDVELLRKVHADLQPPPCGSSGGCALEIRLRATDAPPAMVDMLLGMLALDPAARTTARDALTHPWFAAADPARGDDETEEDDKDPDATTPPAVLLPDPPRWVPHRSVVDLLQRVDAQIQGLDARAALERARATRLPGVVAERRAWHATHDGIT